jgi:hypothetical protein
MHDNIRASSAYGACVIVTAIFLLNSRYTQASANIGALVFTLIGASYLYLTPEKQSQHQMISFIPLAPFITVALYVIKQLSDRKEKYNILTENILKKIEKVHHLYCKKAIKSQKKNYVEQIDRFLIMLIDISFIHSKYIDRKSVKNIRENIQNLIKMTESRRNLKEKDQAVAELINIDSDITTWIDLKYNHQLSDYMRNILYLFGIGALLILVTQRSSGLLSDLLLILCISACSYLLFKIRDLNRMRPERIKERTFVFEQTYEKLGHEMYLPEKILLTKELPNPVEPITVRTIKDDGKKETINLEPSTVLYNTLTTFFTVLSLLLMIFLFLSKNRLSLSQLLCQ